MSKPTRPDLPDARAGNYAQRVRETLMTYLGRQGDPLDQGLTIRDLLLAGIIKLRDGAILRAGISPLPIEPVNGGGGGGSDLGDPGTDPYVPDLTPPPTPGGFMLTAGVAHIYVEHEFPMYAQGHGHLRTRVYGATWTAGPLPTFNNAVEVGQFTGVFWPFASNPATTWHMWIKWETMDGVLSVVPAGGINGLVARTAEDVSLLLEALEGSITESQLYTSLGERIDLIDGDQIGSVNHRISAGVAGGIAIEASARESADNLLFAQYTIKIDANGYVAGYGLASTPVNGAAQSSFAVRADQFYIASPSGPGIIPTLPFIVRTTPTVIDGISIPVGVYMQEAMIQNGTITNAKIGNLAVDDAKIASIDASKITTGYLNAARILSQSISVDKLAGGVLEATITVGGSGPSAPLVLSGNGEIVSNGSSGNKARFYSGDVEIYKNVPGVGQVLYKAISRVEGGVASNGNTVTIPGYFKLQPKVMISLANLMLYQAAYGGQNQTVVCSTGTISETTLGSMVWRFMPTAMLVLADSFGTTVINQSSGITSSNVWYSSTYTTPANTINITPSVSIASYRGSGVGTYFRRSVRWRLEYWNGSVWVPDVFHTTALADSTSASAASSAVFTFPSASAWQFRIYAEAFDTDGSTFGAPSYIYAEDTVTRTGTVDASAATSSPVNLTYTPSYSVPVGWSAINYRYRTTYDYQMFTSTGGSATITGGGIYHSVRGTNGSAFGTGLVAEYNAGSNFLRFTLYGSTPQGSLYSGYAYLAVHSTQMTVTRSQAVSNSTTPVNSFLLSGYNYSLTSAQMLASGSLSWIALGE